MRQESETEERDVVEEAKNDERSEASDEKLDISKNGISELLEKDDNSNSVEEVRDDDREEIREDDDPTQRMQGKSDNAIHVSPVNPQKSDPPFEHSVPSHCPPTTDEDALDRRDDDVPDRADEREVRLVFEEERLEDVPLRMDDVPELRLLPPDDRREEDEQNHGYC